MNTKPGLTKIFMKISFLTSILLLCFACGQPASSDSNSETEVEEGYASPNEIDESDAEAQKDGPVVYVTHDGDKYHTADCRFSKTAHPVRLNQAKAGGKTACSVCKPNSKSGARQVRCSGKTAEGKRCSRTTTDASGKCFQHRDS